MCGRFTLRTKVALLAKMFEFVFDGDWPPRWNIAPTQPVLAVRTREDGTREGARLQWGLIPFWSKDGKMAASMINARAETVSEKPAFRVAFRRRRCLIPADGFFEWQRVGTKKVPHLISLRSEEPFAFAGLWERWVSPVGEAIESCTVVTTTPNELMATIHDRMPVIVRPADYGVWLGRQLDDVLAWSSLLVPYPADEMQAELVSDIISNARNEVDPRLTDSSAALRPSVQRGLFDGAGE